LCACLAAFSCSARKEHVDLTLHLDPPPDTDATVPDTSCFGVVGFEVTITSNGNVTSSGPVLNSGAVVSLDQCALSRPATAPNLDPDVPAIVTVSGHDGAGDVRVRVSTTFTSFTGGSQRLALAPSGTHPPVLVLDKTTLLGSLGNPSDIVTIEVVTTMRPVTWITVNKTGAGAYFDVDPTAFGIDSTHLSPDGATNGTMLDVIFTMSNGTVLPRKRITLMWKPPYYLGQ
jgi:hypothetical protein